ncbi:HSP20-like chaperone [Mycena sp. CBHHK59/15]|nr:HSP20-like chaperone [Mycena sp. CBHHK59/15]
MPPRQLLHPQLLWAQRSSKSEETKNIVYLTVNLPDIQADTLEFRLEPEKIFFKAKSGSTAIKHVKDYAFNLDLFAEIIPEKSSQILTARWLYLVLHKKEPQAEYWPRLTRKKVKNEQIKTDFSKCVDSDEQGPDVDDNDDLEARWNMPPDWRAKESKRGMNTMMGGIDFEKMMAEIGGAGGAALFKGGGPPPAILEPKSTFCKRKTRDYDEEDFGTTSPSGPANAAEAVRELGDLGTLAAQPAGKRVRFAPPVSVPAP